MTLTEILKMIKRKYAPAQAYLDQDIIDEINELQKELFRTIYKKTTTTQYTLLADNPWYPLSFSQSKVNEILVNGERYEYKDIKNKGLSRFVYFTNDSIGVYPTPTADGTMLVFHDVEPYKLTTNDTGRAPDFDPDFHMMLVYGTCIALAESDGNDDAVNGFTAKYNGLETDFMAATDTPEYRVIENVWEGMT